LASLAYEDPLTADVSRLAPDVFPPREQIGDSGSPDERFKQFDAMGRVLRHVAARTPLVIILDDVHWADQPSLLLLQHVARTLTDERLLFVLNYRETEQRHSAIVTDLLREPMTREIHLAGLPAPAVGEQLAAVIGHDVSDREAEEVRELTRGNPFFVGEIGRLLGDGRAGDGSSLVTATVREAIAARLRRLSPECVQLLHAASIVGRDVPIALVAAVVDLPVADCLDPFDEAVAAGLVEAGPTPGEYHFVHALVREAVEAGLPTSERVRLHRSAAEAIEKAYAELLEPHLFDLARHWAVAAVQGEAAIAAGWIQRAAEEAMHGLAFEEAARLFQQALDVGGAHLNDVDRCRILLRAAGALHASADINGRLDACVQAAAVARRLERFDLLAEAALILEGVFGHPESDLATRRLCQEALAGLDPDQMALRSRVLARFAEACMYICDEASAGPASEEALSLAQDAGDREALVGALHARRLVCEGPGGVADRERLADWMLALNSESPDPSVEMWARLWRVDASFERGDLLAVARELETLGPIVQQLRSPWAQWHLLRGRGVLAQAQARFEDARRLAAAAFDAIARTGDPFAGLPRAGLLQTVGHHVGHDRESLNSYGLADDSIDGVSSMTPAIMLVLGPAHLLTEVGRLAEAATLYRSLGPVTGWRPQAHGTLATYSYGIGVAIALDARSDVAALRELLSPFRGLHAASGAGAVAYFGPVELWLGVAEGYLGLLDEAVVDLEGAVHACAVNGAAGFRAEGRYELAAVLARRDDRGDRTRARSLVAEASREALALGMTPIAAKAAVLIERLHTSEPATPLTRREREVAELVAAGLTSREMATRLYLSERTVQNHVQHILTKLNLSNRSQIAVWVTTEMSTPPE
jgi:DNA-binding CsgD family transcriptional regulator